MPPHAANATTTAAHPAPPLAPGLPVIGSLPEISRLGILEFLARQWRTRGDTFRVNAGGRHMVVVVHPDAVERVLGSGRENYVKGATYSGIRMLVGDGLLTLEGEPWRRRRRLEQPSFHRESIRQLAGEMVAVTRETLAEWRERLPAGGTLDVHHEMMRLTLEVVGRTLFGQSLGTRDADASGRACGEALALISDRSNSPLQLPLAIPTPTNVRMRRAFDTLDRVVHDVIARARRAGPDAARQHPTLLNMLLAARDADTGAGLTDAELRDEVVTLVIAGHETTALLLTWAFTLLGRHPEVVARMRAEVAQALGGREPTADDLPRMPYVRQVIDEVLRLRPPAWAVARDAVADDVIAGYRVQRGDMVMPVAYLTHRHPEFWSDPERFDPERFAPERARARHHWAYYPFSLGPRMCIGNIFSLVEAQLVLAMLLQQLDFELAPACEAWPDARVTLRPDGPVDVRIRWRGPDAG